MKVKILTAAFCFVFLFGCVSGSSIITGTARPAIDPNDVKVYLDPPASYETIGLVEASGEVGTSRQATQDKVILQLKKQAAKVGANGILLIDTASSNTANNSGGFVATGFTTGGVTIGLGGGNGGGSKQYLSAKARAIYVAEEATEAAAEE